MPSLTPSLFQDLVEFAPDALILVDSSGIIVYANAHAHTLFGYESGALNGIEVELLIPAESRQLHVSHRNAYSREPRSREMGGRGMPLFGLRKNGSRFPAEIRLAPIRTPDGTFSAAAVRDATESQQIMTVLASARQSAEEANQAKGRLLAAASHDLRQPMQTLRLLNGALKRLLKDPDVIDILDQEEQALGTMSELLHALLNISKLESGTLQPGFQTTSVRALFEELEQQFQSLARLKNLQFEIVGAGDVYIHTDPVLLREMIQNLLANALRYTDKGHVVLRCTSRANGRVLIEVEDSGIGIPEALQQRIFDDFFQAADRGASHRGGAGLGLGIVRRLALTLNTPLSLTSTVGVGSRFTVEVPEGKRQEAPQVESQSIPPLSQEGGYDIILIEDNQSMRDALKTFLLLDSHKVHTAGSLSELDRLLEEMDCSPAIVISDFDLGAQERGSDAIEMIRKHFATQLPAVLLTGDTSAIPSKLATEAEIRVLNKPVDCQRLVNVMAELLSARASVH